MRNPADARLANLLGAASTGLNDAVEGAMLAAVPRLDGTVSTALVSFLDFSPAGSVRTLSRVVGLTHSGAVRLVDRLVAAGYVERAPGHDSRTLALTLTPAGTAVAESVRAARESAITRTLAQLSDSQRDALTEICEVLVSQLTQVRLEQRAAGGEPTGGALCRLCDFAACGRPDGDCPAARARAAFEQSAPAD